MFSRWAGFQPSSIFRNTLGHASGDGLNLGNFSVNNVSSLFHMGGDMPDFRMGSGLGSIFRPFQGLGGCGMDLRQFTGGQTMWKIGEGHSFNPRTNFRFSSIIGRDDDEVCHNDGCPPRYRDYDSCRDHRNYRSNDIDWPDAFRRSGNGLSNFGHTFASRVDHGTDRMFNGNYVGGFGEVLMSPINAIRNMLSGCEVSPRHYDNPSCPPRFGHNGPTHFLG